MCGLYSFKTAPEEARRLFRYTEAAEFPPRPYVAPTQPIGIVNEENGLRHFSLVRWGLVPSWAKEVKPGKPMINARGETVCDKPSFRNAMKRRRCLIPADGFYEWQGTIPGRKQAYAIHRPDNSVFGFAGLWESWMAPDGSELDSAAIITTVANDTLKPIHDRMPVVIQPEDFHVWLDCSKVDEKTASRLLRPAPDDFFVAEPTIIRRELRTARPASQPPLPGRQMKLL